MNRPDRAYLAEITGAAEEWLRRCNNRPWEGLPVGRANLRVVLAASIDVHVNDRGWITWRAAGRKFTAEPVPAERSGAASPKPDVLRP